MRGKSRAKISKADFGYHCNSDTNFLLRKNARPVIGPAFWVCRAKSRAAFRYAKPQNIAGNLERLVNDEPKKQ